MAYLCNDITTHYCCYYGDRMITRSPSLLPWLKDHVDHVLGQCLPTGVGQSVCVYLYTICVCTVTVCISVCTCVV